jgi:hypothetical protein
MELKLKKNIFNGKSIKGTPVDKLVHASAPPVMAASTLSLKLVSNIANKLMAGNRKLTTESMLMRIMILKRTFKLLVK